MFLYEKNKLWWEFTTFERYFENVFLSSILLL